MGTSCLKDGGSGDTAASVQTHEKVKEKQESPTMRIGRMVTTWPKDGGEEEDTASVHTKESLKEMIGRMATTCPKDEKIENGLELIKFQGMVDKTDPSIKIQILDFDEEELWLEEIANRMETNMEHAKNSYTFKQTVAGEGKTQSSMKSFEEEELWLDDIAESIGLHQDDKRAKSENKGQSDDACEEGQILPKEWKNEEETKRLRKTDA